MTASIETPIDGLEWRLISSNENYEVSECGHVRRCKPNRRGMVKLEPLSPHLAAGYNQYSLYEGTERQKALGHRLVAEAFIGPAPFVGAQVRHLDGTKRNNHFSNLKWGTAAENQADRNIHGTDMRGEDHANAKLATAQVVEIRRRAALGVYHKDIAAEFHVSRQTVGDVVNRRVWAHVT